MAKDLGWHGTGTFGCIGAAMGVATAMGASPAQMNSALSAGATSASGLLNVIRGTSELKPYNAGQASQAGLSAGLIALAGFRGLPDVLDGHQGFLDILSGGAPLDQSKLIVKSPYCVETVYLKPYASCRYAHAPVEAVLALRAAHGFQGQDVDRVHVDTFRLAVFQHDYTDISGVSSAKMSVPYCVAAALTSGEAGMAAFGEAVLHDAATLNLTRRVKVVEDPALTALVPHRRPAVVTVHMKNGQSHTARVDLPKGEPETAMSDAELRTKFIDLAVFAGYGRDQAKAMADTVLDPAAAKLPLIRALQ
jgi:2-methylcitrate dehydratase PrpD